MDEAALAKKIEDLNSSVPPRIPIRQPAEGPATAPQPPESEEDDPSLEIAEGKECRRRACTASYRKGASREGEKCQHHPGVPIFHEGSKGYTCCKRRVLEFDEFMKIEGCKVKDKHMFIGSGKTNKANAGAQERLTTVR